MNTVRRLKFSWSHGVEFPDDSDNFVDNGPTRTLEDREYTGLRRRCFAVDSDRGDQVPRWKSQITILNQDRSLTLVVK